MLGSSADSNCKPYFIPDDAFIEFIEVEYSSTVIHTLVIKISNAYYSFWGDQPKLGITSML